MVRNHRLRPDHHPRGIHGLPHAEAQDLESDNANGCHFTNGCLIAQGHERITFISGHRKERPRCEIGNVSPFADQTRLISATCKSVAHFCAVWINSTIPSPLSTLIAGGLRSLVTVVGPARETPCTAGANTDDAMYLHLP